MEIKTKFDIGDKVYKLVYRSEVVDIPCETCNGVGGINHNGLLFYCPACSSFDDNKYKGRVKRMHNYMDISEPMIVDSIRILKEKEKITIVYRSKFDRYNENEIMTLEEAKQAVEKWTNDTKN